MYTKPIIAKFSRSADYVQMINVKPVLKSVKGRCYGNQFRYSRTGVFSLSFTELFLGLYVYIFFIFLTNILNLIWMRPLLSKVGTTGCIRGI